MKTDRFVVAKVSRVDVGMLIGGGVLTDPADAERLRALRERLHAEWCEANNTRARFSIQVDE
jgi:hypothetical protein